MTGKSKLFAALLLLAGVVFLALAFTTGKKAEKANIPLEADLKRITIVVAKDRIPFGEPVTAAMVETQKVIVAPSQAYKNVEAVVGKRPVFSIEAGSTLTPKYFEPSAVAAEIREGHRAFALRLDDSSASTGKIKAGDFVDVFSVFNITTDQKTRKTEMVSRMVLPKLRVLAVGEQLVNTPEAAEEQNTNDRRATKRPERAVTVEVKTEDVNGLALAQAQGELFVVIRNPEDTNLPDLAMYPAPRNVLKPLPPEGDDLAKDKAKMQAAVQAQEETLASNPENSAYAGVAATDVILPGSADLDAIPRQPIKESKEVSKPKTIPRPRPPSTVEVIRAGEATQEKAR